MKWFDDEFGKFLLVAVISLALIVGVILGKAITKEEAEQKAYAKLCCDTGAYCCFEEKVK